MKLSLQKLEDLRASRDRGIGEAMRLELLGHVNRANALWTFVEALTAEIEAIEASLEDRRAA